MVQTSKGAKKAIVTIKAKYGEDFYRRAGRKGGAASRGGGFGSNKVGVDGLTGRERAKIAGAKGGRISRRTGIKNGEGVRANKDILEAERILEEESGRD